MNSVKNVSAMPGSVDVSFTFNQASTGKLFLILSLFPFFPFSNPLQPLDYEKKPSYTVEIQVQNTHVDPRFMSAGSKDMATVRIAVEDVDEPPLFDKASYLMEMKEDAGVGAAVGSVSAVDPDGARSMVK